MLEEKRSQFADAETRLKYKFRDGSLLETAFTHSTYANAHGTESNERLEYLGDSVLQLVVSELLYFQESDGGKGLSEGEMTTLRQTLVRKEALLAAAGRLELGKYLLAEGGAANVGDKTISSLFETVTAAIYLDGGYEAAKTFVLTNLENTDIRSTRNYKGLLQEWLQKRGCPHPDYEGTKTGKDNSPVFVCTARGGGAEAEGTGRSKVSAEQEAAKKLLEILSKNRES